MFCGLVLSHEREISYIYRDANRNYFKRCVINEVNINLPPINTKTKQNDESFAYLTDITVL